MARQTRVALGFRAHTGWAAAVAVAPAWEVLERRRIAYEPDATRFVYHRAAEVSSDEAEALIGTARGQAGNKALQEIRTLIADLSSRGIAIAGVCVPGGNVTLPSSLDKILAAHSRIHAAEGAFYRDVLAEACAGIGIGVCRAPERDLWQLASTAFARGEAKLREHLTALGKKLGPPWGEDQRLAALAAFIALNAQT